MPKARLYFDGDNSGIEKEARIYSLTQEVEDRLDSISDIEDDIDDLQDQINNLASRGRYLSTWNAVTGLPDTQPQVDPYVYRAGDYYIVSNVGGTNYRPQGSEYHIGVASQAIETQGVAVNDLYIYDGIQWIRQGSGGTVSIVWGSITGTLSNQTDLQNALDAKQDTLTAGNNITISNNVISSENTTYTAGTGISIDSNNVISNTQTSAEWGNITGTLSDQTDLQSALNNKQDKLTAGDNITIGDVCIAVSDMQGPAPDGFHVPLSSEWQALCGVLTSTFGLASNATTVGTYLKMPMAGYLYCSSSDVYNVDSFGYYWSSTAYSADNAYHLRFSSLSLNPQYGNRRANGYTVRCFKDSPVAPDSSWTTLYDGSTVASGAGVFWSSSLGLISVSGDGQTWYTIMDKNLGATTVYNQGDTLTDANCGYFYQWGNNYGFPHSGTVTTSSTQVDASGYGPGNYYESSTFITTSSSPYDWSSVTNDNLRGGVSQGTSQKCNLTISAQAPKTYTAGENIQISSSNVISATDTTYTAGTGIEILNGDNYSAMQGPSPTGYHVPSKDEWVALCGILTSTFGLASNPTTVGTYLKMPMAGSRLASSSNVKSAGSNGLYWSSTAYSAGYAYYLDFYSSSLSPQNGDYRAFGFTVRCFKDSPVAPDSDWTTLYDGSSVTTGAGVFWSSSQGLISVSGDGTTWYTIQDKNLGATTVYNQGDTLTDANCGYFYQWGNNYGFPHSGTVTTSSTQVDASSYGPGNYYSSSTFITRSSSPYDWSSVQNDNLRGGETGVVTLENAITNIGVLSGDSGVVYIITVSNSDPATGTARNIITLVP